MPVDELSADVEDTVGASLFLASKLLETQCNPQNIVWVLLTVLKEPLPGLFTQDAQVHQDALYAAEMHILKKLGFQVEVSLWYSLAINYLQILDLSREEEVSQRVWSYCNDLYVSQPSDLICRLRTTLTCLHSPPTLACTAIFLATRDLQIKLPQGWMEIFDVDVQDVVHASAHVKVFYHEEEKRIGATVPVTLADLENYLRKRRG